MKARRKKCPALEVVSYLLLGNRLQLPSVKKSETCLSYYSDAKPGQTV